MIYFFGFLFFVLMMAIFFYSVEINKSVKEINNKINEEMKFDHEGDFVPVPRAIKTNVLIPSQNEQLKMDGKVYDRQVD